MLIFSLCQEACKLGSAYVKLQKEHDALKKQHAEDNGKDKILVYNIEVKLSLFVTSV